MNVLIHWLIDWLTDWYWIILLIILLYSKCIGVFLGNWNGIFKCTFKGMHKKSNYISSQEKIDVDVKLSWIPPVTVFKQNECCSRVILSKLLHSVHVLCLCLIMFWSCLHPHPVFDWLLYCCHLFCVSSLLVWLFLLLLLASYHAFTSLSSNLSWFFVSSLWLLIFDCFSDFCCLPLFWS